MSIMNSIDRVQDSIFVYDIKRTQQNLSEFAGDLKNFMSGQDEKFLNTINGILQYLNIAISNKDYLLAADLLEYELKPLLNSKIN